MLKHGCTPLFQSSPYNRLSKLMVVLQAMLRRNFDIEILNHLFPLWPAEDRGQSGEYEYILVVRCSLQLETVHSHQPYPKAVINIMDLWSPSLACGERPLLGNGQLDCNLPEAVVPRIISALSLLDYARTFDCFCVDGVGDMGMVRLLSLAFGLRSRVKALGCQAHFVQAFRLEPFPYTIVTTSSSSTMLWTSHR